MASLRSLRALPISRILSPASCLNASRALAFRYASGQLHHIAKRPFSATSLRSDAGTTDLSLSAAIQEELKYEEETSVKETPDFLKDFREKGVWQIKETVGQDNVVMTRKFGNEKIRVEFSIADLMNPSEGNAYDELAEEEEKNSENQEEESYLPSYPIRVNVVITKSGSPSALAIEAAVQDSTFVIEGASFFKDGSLSTDVSAESDWKRRTIYLGPQYDRLELGLQEKFDEFLKERGVGEELALFIPEYAEWKEQKEYVGWLKGVKGFVDL